MSLERGDRKYLVISAIWLALCGAYASDEGGLPAMLYIGVAPVAALLGWRWVKAAKE